MKRIALFVILGFIAIYGYGQKSIKKLEVGETGSSINLNYKPIVNEITTNGLIVKITPISPEELNAIFLRESLLNGQFDYSKFEKTRSSYFLKKRKKIKEKSDLAFLLEGATWLFDNEKIDQLEFDELFKQIIFKFDNDTEINNYNPVSNISCNPFCINGRYLSVFNIEIANPGNTQLIFDQNIIIANGTDSYRPLPTIFITDLLQRSNLMNVDKLFTLERHYLPSNLSIPSDSKIHKLITTLPIEFKSNELIIALSGTNKQFKWEVVKDENTINDNYTFYEFSSIWNSFGYPLKNSIEFTIVKSKPSAVYVVESNIFINEDNLSEEFEIISLLLNSDKLYYGRNSNLKGADFLDIKKNKRNDIQLQAIIIDDVERKIKY